MANSQLHRKIVIKLKFLLCYFSHFPNLFIDTSSSANSISYWFYLLYILYCSLITWDWEALAFGGLIPVMNLKMQIMIFENISWHTSGGIHAGMWYSIVCACILRHMFKIMESITCVQLLIKNLQQPEKVNQYCIIM